MSPMAQSSRPRILLKIHRSKMEEGVGRNSQSTADLQFEFHEFVPSGSRTQMPMPVHINSTNQDLTHIGSEAVPPHVEKQEMPDEKFWWKAEAGESGTTDYEVDATNIEEQCGFSPGVHLPLSVETKPYLLCISLLLNVSRFLLYPFSVALNEHSPGSLNECGICGPASAIWVPDKSEDGEPLIEHTSEHGQILKIDPVDTFWIQCDECGKWFHGGCVGVEEYEDVLIDKFHCPRCATTKGPTKMKTVILRHRFAFDDLSQANLPTEVGTEVWIKDFIKREANIPPPSDQHVTICKDGFEFMEQFDRRANWKKVFLIEEARGLELRVPDRDEDFTLRTIVEILGRTYKVDTIDVYRQVTQSMCIGTFYDKMIDSNRTRLYNILSLEFSQNDKMKKLISPPLLVPELSFVHKLWPDRNDVVNWDPELQQVVEVLEEHRNNKPEVALFCLCGMAGSYTDFHIDFGGSSVWYHIYEGEKVFYIVEPTDKFLNLFEEYQRSETRSETFFGDLLPPGTVRRVVIKKGQTLMIPAGWIHAVYTPKDSLVFGGNFLHALNVPMQLKIYEMEQRLKKLVGTEEKFLFPHFELVNWYAARSLILEQLREANDEGNRADQYILDAATALMPCLKEWMRRDKEAKMNSTQSFNDVLVKLQREINKQHRIRRSLSPACRSPRKTTKKRKSEDLELFVEPGTSTSSVTEAEQRLDAPAVSTDPAAHTPHIELAIPTAEESGEPASDALDEEAPLDIRLKIVWKGKNYASSVVEKPDPMLEEVNMTQMFARRSSSGRQPRPSAWLAEAVGLDELEKTAKKLEEKGEQPPERNVVTYDTEMELACEEEERNLLRDERAKKKGKAAVGTGDLQRPATIAKRKPSTVKQRLAAKLKLK
ncbi:unnamed protein product [Cylicocyclus nassatus]|uniref:JmjC domain-containing protein n=1 Tax=Cylicocyclus nassatus TaxID=53992 RepID=A0AA36GZG0_CYLNA|nr:unnamed protein product [Cylicocyclus nassatus]